MSALISAAATAAPFAAAWSAHSLWMRRRLLLARRDPLTGLDGRNAFEARARRPLLRPGAVVVLVDLDGFKALNDRHGHAAGDAALVAVARRLEDWSKSLRGCAGRLGGDEFAAVVVPQRPGDLPFDLARLHTALCADVQYDGVRLPMGASIGAFPARGLPPAAPELLLRRADEAMYAAKQAGGGWFITHGTTPTRETVNGRRAGRPGTHLPHTNAPAATAGTHHDSEGSRP